MIRPNGNRSIDHASLGDCSRVATWVCLMESKPDGKMPGRKFPCREARNSLAAKGLIPGQPLHLRGTLPPASEVGGAVFGGVRRLAKAWQCDVLGKVWPKPKERGCFAVSHVRVLRARYCYDLRRVRSAAGLR